MTPLKKLKDIQSLDEFDYNAIEVMRGKTPTDIETKCLQLCKHYLSGNWCQQTVESIIVRRVTGGWVNQLYYCSIQNRDTSKDVPQEVIIKFYGENPMGLVESSRIRDVVIAIMFSQNNLGPKIYGLFGQGQIQKFYQHRHFKLDELKVHKNVIKVFKLLAIIHSLDAPLNKNPNAFYEVMVRSYKEAIKILPIEEEINEFNCITLKNFDFMLEFDWIKGVIDRVNTPVVFSHNDFRSGNLLITEPNDDLVICDFDDSGYGYRGFDFVWLFREWGQKGLQFKPIVGMPFDDSDVMPLIKIYIEECDRIQGISYSKNQINSMEHILREIKIFTLFSYLFKVTHTMINDANNGGFELNRQICMEMADISLQNYRTIKRILLKENIII